VVPDVAPDHPPEVAVAEDVAEHVEHAGALLVEVPVEEVGGGAPEVRHDRPAVAVPILLEIGADRLTLDLRRRSEIPRHTHRDHRAHRVLSAESHAELPFDVLQGEQVRPRGEVRLPPGVPTDVGVIQLGEYALTIAGKHRGSEGWGGAGHDTTSTPAGSGPYRLSSHTPVKR